MSFTRSQDSTHPRVRASISCFLSSGRLVGRRIPAAALIMDSGGGAVQDQGLLRTLEDSRTPEDSSNSLNSSNSMQHVVDFVLELEKLKAITRKVKPLGLDRYENSAEHSWQLMLFAVSLAPYAAAPINVDRV